MFKRPDRDAATEEGSLTPERFGQIRAIFEAALDKPEAERQGYAVTACSGDADLLKEVHAMLKAEQSADALLDGQTPGTTPPSDITSGSPDEGRFPAGTVLAGRYRVLGLLGKGGMGEVYRAFDIILNQTVALKFLSESRFTEAALVRFRNEVRIARQVSHPNVCRVYDMGMADGLHFLSMEYIDGEDLASLLRRIGRLPEDKATEFTRKICAGLSAAHDRGVLHRDLKPANIMIDGKGRVRITDFGLAGLADEIPLSDLRSGTPAYMAPEQKAGKEVTVRSDIYALGLILHEMFTGQMYRGDSQSNPTDLVSNLDPAIERLILRCLEERASRRPATAMRVMMSLPGASPLAAALAAGETPSPEMVAASEEREGFGPRTAVACFAAILLTFAMSLWMADDFGTFAYIPLPEEPEVLTFQIEELLEELGYDEPPLDTASGFRCCDESIDAFLNQATPEELDLIQTAERIPLAHFWYRQHREPFVPTEVWHGNFVIRAVTLESPPNSEPGMIRAQTDPTGRLLSLEVQTWEMPARPVEVDWNVLFQAAGLDPERFDPVEPDRIPPVAVDTQLAWSGTMAGLPMAMIRIEAASWRGHPVLFEVETPDGPVQMTPPARVTGSTALGGNLGVALNVAVLGLAWWNWRRRRLDWRGAAVLGVAGLALRIGGGATNNSIMVALSTMAIYLAIEPHIRRHWPEALISWSRFTHGNLGNPLIASHLLAGTAFGIAVGTGVRFLLVSQVAAGPVWFNPTGRAVLALNQISQSLYVGLGMLTMLIIVRLVIPWPRVADLIATSILVFGLIPPEALLSGVSIAGFVLLYLSISLIWGFGLLSMLTAYVSIALSAFTPLAASGWLAPRLIPIHLVPVAIAAWALWVILSARKPSDPNAEVRA